MKIKLENAGQFFFWIFVLLVLGLTWASLAGCSKDEGNYSPPPSVEGVWNRDSIIMSTGNKYYGDGVLELNEDGKYNYYHISENGDTSYINVGTTTWEKKGDSLHFYFPSVITELSSTNLTLFVDDDPRYSMFIYFTR